VEVRFSSPPKEDIESRMLRPPLPWIAGGIDLSDRRGLPLGRYRFGFDGDSLKKTTTQSGDSHFEGSTATARAQDHLHTSYGSISIHKIES